MNTFDFETQLKDALKEKPGLSAEREATLFEKAEDLLGARRERVALKLKKTKDIESARRGLVLKIRTIPARMWDFLANHPDAPAAATALMALVLAFVMTFPALHSHRETYTELTYSDLPALPKTNDVPARYDAQVLAERQAYEREVENAHDQTSGGT